MDLGHRVRRIVSPQLIEEAANSPLHRSLVDEERAGDSLVTAPAGDQLQYFNMVRFQELGEKQYLSGSGWLAGDKIGSLIWSVTGWCF